MGVGDPFLTLHEIAEIGRKAGLGGLDSYEWKRRAAIWHGRRPDLCIMRDGKHAYHLTLLPKAMQKAAEALVVPPSPPPAELWAAEVDGLIKARAACLAAVERYQKQHRVTFGAAVDAFVVAVNLEPRAYHPVMHREVAGFGLPLETLFRAKERKSRIPGAAVTVSRRTIYGWKKEAATAPGRPDGKEVERRVREFSAVSRFFTVEADEVIDHFVRCHRERILDAIARDRDRP